VCLVEGRQRECEDEPFGRVVLVPDDRVAVVAREFVMEVVVADGSMLVLQALGSGMVAYPSPKVTKAVKT
jgi:hypothetical protein